MKLTISLLECNRCGHKWWPRILGGEEARIEIPAHCAKCKTPYWNKPRVKPIKK